VYILPPFDYPPSSTDLFFLHLLIPSHQKHFLLPENFAEETTLNSCQQVQKKQNSTPVKRCRRNKTQLLSTGAEETTLNSCQQVRQLKVLGRIK
jgi:hypothetical protein